MKNKKLTKIEKRAFIIEKVKDELKYLSKDELEWICIDFGIKYTDEDWKEHLAEKIIKNNKNKKMNYMKIYEEYKQNYFGMTVWEVEELLNINGYKRKELQKHEILKVLYMYETKAFFSRKKKISVPVYDTDNVLDLVGEDLGELLKEARRLEKVRKNSMKKSENVQN
ncbi:MAG: hypothetical protein ACLS90_03390 [Clostridia bacterium]